jgi:hypothetical protein
MGRASDMRTRIAGLLKELGMRTGAGGISRAERERHLSQLLCDLENKLVSDSRVRNRERIPRIMSLTVDEVVDGYLQYHDAGQLLRDLSTNRQARTKLLRAAVDLVVTAQALYGNQKTLTEAKGNKLKAEAARAIAKIDSISKALAPGSNAALWDLRELFYWLVFGVDYGVAWYVKASVDGWL